MTTVFHKCVNNPNVFCYVCGEFTSKKQRCSISPCLKKAYEFYYGSKLVEKKSWAPNNICSTCKRGLHRWLRGKNKSMRFGNPMIWTEQTNHTTDCYFCLTNIIGHNTKTKRHIFYPDVSSAKKPINHDLIPIPRPPEEWTVDKKEPSNASPDDEPGSSHSNTDLNFSNLKIPHSISQNEFNDLARDLNLSKARAELLGSHLQGWNLLQDGVEVSYWK